MNRHPRVKPVLYPRALLCVERDEKGELILLYAFALVCLGGLFGGFVAEKCHLPRLLGMLLVGMLLGAEGFALLGEDLLALSPVLRQIALVIILTRAGLNLKWSDLKAVGRPALLLCFLPACLEILGMILLAPPLLGLSHLEGALLGCVVAAVSPAVIVPRMLQLMEEGYGREKRIPEMLLAGASVDDIFVLVLFSGVLTLCQGASLDIAQGLQLPSALLLGILAGLLLGEGLAWFWKRHPMNAPLQVVLLLSISFLCVSLEELLQGRIGFSGLLAVMFLGIHLQQNMPALACGLSERFSALWAGAELWLFVLVGASVPLAYAFRMGFWALLLVALVLLFRVGGVWLSLLGTKLDKKERLFSVFAYLPKATVQAAIGGIPLNMGLASGETILTVAVVSILLTAPLGAILMDATYRRLLRPASDNS